MIEYNATSFAITERTSVYEAKMEYVEKSGNRFKVEQAVVTNWEDR